MTVNIRQLRPGDAATYHAFRRQMLVAAPLAFLSAPDDDLASDIEVVRERLAAAPQNVVFGAFTDSGDLVGAVGVYREPRRKTAHRAAIWGMFVTPAFRRSGVGRRLVEAAVAHARTLDGVLQVHLGVSTAAPEAHALYESVGFRAWGLEPRALCDGGRFTDEHHMVYELDR